MYIREHYPAHFYAEYGEYEITVDIETGVVTGKFPKRALKAVIERYELHQDELMYFNELTKVVGFPDYYAEEEKY